MIDQRTPPPAPSNAIHTVIVIALILAGIGLIYRAVSLKMQNAPAPVAARSDCIQEVKTFEMKDSYLRGIIPKGQAFDVQMGYYNCNDPQPGDVALFRISENLEPVVKIVRGVSGDEFELIENEKLRRWEIKINNRFVTYREQNYYFGRTNGRNQMRKYYDEHDGELQAGDLILFSLIPPGIQDSGTFGPVRLDDLLGKVVLANPRQTASTY